MNSIYFKLDDDFEKIINQVLKSKKINKMKLIPTGWTNIVYEVETNDENYFFRFPRDEFWSRTIVKDYEFAKYIYGKTDYDTIKLELLYDGIRPFSMHKKIPGVSLAERMNELNSDEIEIVSKEIAKFMSQLHSLSFNEKEVFTIDNISLNLSSFLDELLKIHLSKEDLKFWEPLPVKNDICLVHGDLNSSNILLDANNHVRAIIDFGFGGFGKKYDDVSRIIGRCPASFKEKIIEFYELYSGKKLDIDILEQNIEIWQNIDQGYINYMRKIGIYK